MAEKVAIDENKFIEQALELLKVVADKGIVLRIIGALAVRLHLGGSEELKNIFIRLSRLGEGKHTYTDLDLAAYNKQNKLIEKFMDKDMGYESNKMLNALYGNRRMIFFNTKYGYSIDVFFDKLEFSHDVHWGKEPGNGRLELDYPTLNLSDLVLEKIQIHQISYKDLVDLTALFMSHDIYDIDERDSINGRYVAKILSDDWGFWYDATGNLKKTLDTSRNFQEEGKISQPAFNTVQERIQKLLKYIEDEPKTKNWRKRARKGTSKPWYREVEEVQR